MFHIYDKLKFFAIKREPLIFLNLSPLGQNLTVAGKTAELEFRDGTTFYWSSRNGTTET